MGLVTQYSRLLHHTITGASGSTFSVPASEDFTDGSWTVYDLNLSEIGVNETDEKAYIRIGSGIKEFQFTGGTGGGQSLSQVLAVGDFAGTYSIRMGSGKIISTNNISSLTLSDSSFNFDSGTVSQSSPNVTHTSPVYSLIIEAITTTASTQRLWTFDANELGTTDALFNYEYTGQGYDIVSGNIYVEKTNGALSCIGGTWSSTPLITQNVNNTTFTGSASLIFDTDLAQLIYIDALGESGTTIRWSARLNYFYTTY